MPIDMRIWRIWDGRLETVRIEKLQSEASLENWLAANGDLAVLELKRDRTPRDFPAVSPPKPHETDGPGGRNRAYAT